MSVITIPKFFITSLKTEQPFQQIIRNASKKTGGSTKNPKGHPRPKHRGWRVQDGHYVSAGTILATQMTTRFHPGLNVGFGRNGTLFALDHGKVFVTCEKIEPNWNHSWIQRNYAGFFYGWFGYMLHNDKIISKKKHKPRQHRLYKSVVPSMSIICLGPKGSGKTHLLTALENPETVDNTTYSIPTIGTNIFTINFPSIEGNSKKKSARKSVNILEIGGSMAPLWRQYFSNLCKILYVVDTSNLCQISAAGVLLYSILAEPRLQRTKILLVLTKMDLAYRQMRNEALLMLQMVKLKKQIRQNLTIVETSAISRHGLEDIYKWLDLR